MKPKTLLLLGGAALVAWWFYRKNQTVNPTSPLSMPSNYSPAQPSQQYPFLANVAPRVDNKNQPWYVGTQVPAVGLPGTANDLAAVNSIVHSVSDIWGNLGLGGLFGSTDDAASNLIGSADDYSWIPDDSELAGASDFDADWGVGEADDNWESDWA